NSAGAGGLSRPVRRRRPGPVRDRRPLGRRSLNPPQVLLNTPSRRCARATGDPSPGPAPGVTSRHGTLTEPGALPRTLLPQEQRRRTPDVAQHLLPGPEVVLPA